MVVGSEKGYVNKVVNAPKAEEVTLLIAPYWISSEDVTYRRALRKIGRKA